MAGRRARENIELLQKRKKKTTCIYYGKQAQKVTSLMWGKSATHNRHSKLVDFHPFALLCYILLLQFSPPVDDNDMTAMEQFKHVFL